MQQSTPVIDGWMIAGNTRKPIEVRYASRHSLWTDIDGDLDHTQVDNIELRLADRMVELGRCRVVQETSVGDRLLRLVPVDLIHDFEKLFFFSRVETLETATLNLPLILSYKDRIDPYFRNYVSDLTYDVNVYRNAVDRMDMECDDEPEDVKEIVQQGIISSFGKTLLAFLADRFDELVRVVDGFSEKEHEHHGFYFRKQLWNVILSAPIMARTNLKPRGYSGDSEMMRMIYQNDYQGTTTFGKIVHYYALGQPAAQAVRNRRLDIARMIHEYIVSCNVTAPERIRILSVACGPAWELREILASPSDCERLHLSLLDQDQQALLEAETLIGNIEERLRCGVSVDFIKESVRTMLVTRQLDERWGRFHFVYSMGLFDYLTPPVAAAVLKKLFYLLKPDGEMIVGNLSVGNPSRYFMEYWLDWRIILRSEEEFLKLTVDLPGAEASVQFDETRIQMVLRNSEASYGWLMWKRNPRPLPSRDT